MLIIIESPLFSKLWPDYCGLTIGQPMSMANFRPTWLETLRLAI
jgi:hypothetical protein